MFKHVSLMWLCGAMVAFAVVVVVFTGKAFALLPAFACMAMMVLMMRMMGRGSGQGPDGDKP